MVATLLELFAVLDMLSGPDGGELRSPRAASHSESFVRPGRAREGESAVQPRFQASVEVKLVAYEDYCDGEAVLRTCPSWSHTVVW